MYDYQTFHFDSKVAVYNNPIAKYVIKGASGLSIGMKSQDHDPIDWDSNIGSIRTLGFSGKLNRFIKV